MDFQIDSRPFDALSAEDRRLCEQAQEVAGKAYAPYSGFAVGVAVRTASGEIFTGANLENASYGLSICGEVAALAQANTHGAEDIRTIAVTGYKFAPQQDDRTIVTPCGRCRQLIWEASSRAKFDIRVICCSGDLTKVAVFTASELLPAAFDVAALRHFDEHPPRHISSTVQMRRRRAS